MLQNLFCLLFMGISFIYSFAGRGYSAFMGRYSTLVGSAAFVMMFVGSNTVKFLGWRAGALMTPGMMGLLAAPFFICLTGMN